MSIQDFAIFSPQQKRHLQTFLNKSPRRFWNNQAQHEFRRLKFGYHQGGKLESRAEYAIRLYAEARELQPAMSLGEIIQKLAQDYHEEIKYAKVGRGISHIDSLVELLENFDRIGPIYRNKEEIKERKTQQEGLNDLRINRSQEQPPWRTQARGSPQDRTTHPQHQN